MDQELNLLNKKLVEGMGHKQLEKFSRITLPRLCEGER